jgi:hypothetical protein
MNFAEKFIAGEFAVSSSHLLSGLTAYSSHFVLCVCFCVIVQITYHLVCCLLKLFTTVFSCTFVCTTISATLVILNQMQRSILRRWKTF